uniref:SR-related and CTD-associated factor 8-like n=1 Tax=Panthera onca TaxID=9690 RepID=UPI002952D32F|nr:SR-related and CTD-associated factor 8-like [Panthera onca]
MLQIPVAPAVPTVSLVPPAFPVSMPVPPPGFSPIPPPPFLRASFNPSQPPPGFMPPPVPPPVVPPPAIPPVVPTCEFPTLRLFFIHGSVNLLVLILVNYKFFYESFNFLFILIKHSF